MLVLHTDFDPYVIHVFLVVGVYSHCGMTGRHHGTNDRYFVVEIVNFLSSCELPQMASLDELFDFVL